MPQILMLMLKLLNKAFKKLQTANSNCKKTVLLVDSLAFILAISSYKENGFVDEVRGPLLKFVLYRLVHQWIPSHCDLSGNERVDILGKITKFLWKDI